MDSFPFYATVIVELWDSSLSDTARQYRLYRGVTTGAHFQHYWPLWRESQHKMSVMQSFDDFSTQIIDAYAYTSMILTAAMHVATMRRFSCKSKSECSSAWNQSLYCNRRMVWNVWVYMKDAYWNICQLFKAFRHSRNYWYMDYVMEFRVDISKYILSSPASLDWCVDTFILQ